MYFIYSYRKLALVDITQEKLEAVANLVKSKFNDMDILNIAVDLSTVDPKTIVEQVVSKFGRKLGFIYCLDVYVTLQALTDWPIMRPSC